VVGLVLLAWILLAVLPLDREEPRVATTATTETITEGQPQQSTTMIEVPPGTTDDSFEIATTTIESPPMASGPTATAAPPPMTSSTRGAPVQRPLVIVTQAQPPATQTQPAPVRVVLPPPTGAAISEGEAAATLRSYVRSRRYYPVAADCVRVESRGYRNAGYNMEVWHSCAGGGSSRLLGRWRVDAKTREVFVHGTTAAICGRDAGVKCWVLRCWVLS